LEMGFVARLRLALVIGRGTWDTGAKARA